LSDQILEGGNEFAFFDTTTDMFRNFSGVHTWDTVDEFKKDFTEEIKDDYDGKGLRRFLNLIPEDWDKKVVTENSEEQSKGEEALKEIENLMERWHMGRDNDDETLTGINAALVKIGKLLHFNKDNNSVAFLRWFDNLKK